MLHTKLHVTAEKCILRGPALPNCLGTHIVHSCFAQHPRCTHCMVLFHTAAWAHTLDTPAMHNILGTHSAWPCFIQQPGHTLHGPVPLNSFFYLFSPRGTILTSFASLLLALWWLLLAVSLVLLTSQWLNYLIRVPENALRGGRVSWNLITVDLLCIKHYNTTANTQHIILSAVSSLYILRYEMRSLWYRRWSVDRFQFDPDQIAVSPAP